MKNPYRVIGFFAALARRFTAAFRRDAKWDWTSSPPAFRAAVRLASYCFELVFGLVIVGRCRASGFSVSGFNVLVDIALLLARSRLRHKRNQRFAGVFSLTGTHPHKETPMFGRLLTVTIAAASLGIVGAHAQTTGVTGNSPGANTPGTASPSTMGPNITTPSTPGASGTTSLGTGTGTSAALPGATTSGTGSAGSTTSGAGMK